MWLKIILKTTKYQPRKLYLNIFQSYLIQKQIFCYFQLKIFFHASNSYIFGTSYYISQLGGNNVNQLSA